ncbi:MAG: putative toxin-antitoxin system toxin component, PIN family [Endomicrobium sp.]|jgi:putative PIN family toxin of toxin-antitoxin system|nr:putative toxin-antitoxin system toxin component, PIN family [Endomicrobium sp.]
MDIVIDTNIIVSALLNPNGAPAKVLNRVLGGFDKIQYDNRILLEYKEVLLRDKFAFDKDLINILLDFIIDEGDFIVSQPQNHKFVDESDKKFYEVFITSKADFLITGNKKHFPLDKKVISPKEYENKITE